LKNPKLTGNSFEISGGVVRRLSVNPNLRSDLSSTDFNSEGAVDTDCNLDVTRAVSHFRVQFESLSLLPFITDSEMDRLFGEEIREAIGKLQRYGEQEKLCRNCTDRCCRLVSCELYAPELSRCPVYPFRPLLCRMHFCRHFTQTYPILVREMGDIFLEGLLAAEKIDKGKAALFDCPPLRKLIPELLGSIVPLIEGVKEGRLEENSILKLIDQQIGHSG
jgi:hypothetical protein